MIRDWMELTKPRILQLNLVAAFGGYWLASRWMVDWLDLMWVLLGTVLTMASSCVMNNVWDWKLDQRMIRTKNRPLAATVILIYMYDYAGTVFLIVSVAAGIVWAWHTLKGAASMNTEKWAKTNFLISVNYLMIVFLMMIIDTAGRPF